MKIARVLLAALAYLVAHGVLAQTYPSKPLRLITPFPPGGGTEAIARIIAHALTEQMGQRVVIDIRSGASGRIGTEIAAASPNDGYTLLFGNVAPLAILPAAMPKLTYEPIKDFTPISLLALADFALAAHPSLPAKSIEDLFALAKSKPGQVTYASSGYLGPTHLAGELINQLARIKLFHIPYRGSGPALVAAMTGETAIMFGSLPAVVPYANTGRLRALATTGRKRSIPGVPALNELLPGYEVTQWYGILVPAGISNEIVEQLNKEIVRAIRSAKISQLLVRLGTQPITTTPNEFRAFLKNETSKWRKVISTANITAE